MSLTTTLQVMMVVYIGLAIASTYHGIGMHVADLDGVDFVYANKLMTFGNFFALGSIAVAKSSFCVTLLRLSASTWQKWLLWTILVTANLMLWLCALFLFTACTPTARKWDPSIHGKCWSYRAQIYFALWSAGEFAVPWKSGGIRTCRRLTTGTQPTRPLPTSSSPSSRGS